MKRSSAAILLAAATALVIVADAVILVAPRVLADPNTSPSAPAAAVAAAATPSATNLWQPPATYFIPLPTPTAAPPTPAPTPVPKVTPVPYRDTVTNAKAYVKARLGQTGYNCYNEIIMRESKWNPLAGRTTGPYGIPQANPGSKMATFGSNWRTSPLTQVKWGLWYLANRYHGSACEAWDFWVGHGWY